jgi:hypothetical protein
MQVAFTGIEHGLPSINGARKLLSVKILYAPGGKRENEDTTQSSLTRIEYLEMSFQRESVWNDASADLYVFVTSATFCSYLRTEDLNS